MSQSVETLDLLGRRADLLALLRESPRTKPELASALSVSRSTVDRAVRNLEAENLVARGDTVSLTLTGALALDAYERFADQLDALGSAGSLFESLPANAVVDPALLRDATVVTPSEVAPHRAVETYGSLVADASRVRGFACAVLDTNVERFRERIVEDEVPVELVVTEDVLDALVATHSDAISDSRESGNLSIYRATQTLAYNLMLVETDATHVCALVHDHDGHVGLVVNDDPDAVAWAEGVYESIREDAVPLPA